MQSREKVSRRPRRRGEQEAGSSTALRSRSRPWRPAGPLAARPHFPVLTSQSPCSCFIDILLHHPYSSSDPPAPFFLGAAAGGRVFGRRLLAKGHALNTQALDEAVTGLHIFFSSPFYVRESPHLISCDDYLLLI